MPNKKKELAEFLGGETLAIKNYMLIHRKNMIVSLCSFIETKLDGFCRSLYKKNNFPKKHTEETRDKGITRARKYITTLTEMDFSKLNSEWSKLKNLFEIRNCIIHCGGDIKISKKKKTISLLEEFVKTSKWLLLKGKRHLEIEKQKFRG